MSSSRIAWSFPSISMKAGRTPWKFPMIGFGRCCASMGQSRDSGRDDARGGGFMSRSPVVPDGLFDSRPYGFAQVTVVPTPFGRAVHVSGQVAWDAEQKIVGAGDIGRQLEKSLDNLAAALASAGATLDQVGALSLYIRRSHMGEGR